MPSPHEIAVAARVRLARGDAAAAALMRWPLGKLKRLTDAAVRGHRPAATLDAALTVYARADVARAAAISGYTPEEIIAEAERRGLLSEYAWRDGERWSAAEDAAIMARYLTAPTARLAAEFGRTVEAVKSRALYLRAGGSAVVRKAVWSNGKRPWAPTEDDVLRTGRGVMTTTEMAARLPGRTVKAIRRRVENLGLADTGD